MKGTLARAAKEREKEVERRQKEREMELQRREEELKSQYKENARGLLELAQCKALFANRDREDLQVRKKESGLLSTENASHSEGKAQLSRELVMSRALEVNAERNADELTRKSGGTRLRKMLSSSFAGAELS
jgi:hypothetical protein